MRRFTRILRTIGLGLLALLPGIGHTARFLERAAGTYRARARAADRPAAACGSDLSWVLELLYVTHFPARRAERAEPARGRDIVHDPAGCVRHLAVSLHRPDRYRGRHAGGRAQSQRA